MRELIPFQDPVKREGKIEMNNRITAVILVGELRSFFHRSSEWPSTIFLSNEFHSLVITYLQGSFSSSESCDRCLTRSKVPVGSLSEKCTPNERFLCGNVPPKLPAMLSDMMLLLSRWSSSSASLSSKWFGKEPQNLYLREENRFIFTVRLRGVDCRCERSSRAVSLIYVTRRNVSAT